jgi:hypothetical protein
MRSPAFRSVLLAAALAAAPARADAQQPLAELPITSLSNLILVQGSIGDSRPLWILLDTGAGRTAVDAPLVDSLGLRVTGQGWAQGAAGRAPMRVLGDVPVRLGGVDLPLATAVSLPFADLEPALGKDVDAVVGQELFARFVVQIDYGGGILRLYDPAAFVAPAAPSVPLEVVRGEAFVRVRVTVDGRTVDARLQLDTGAGSALTLDAPFVRAHGLAAGPGLSGSAAWGVGGRSLQVNRFVERLEIGDVALEAPVATLSLDTTGVLGGGEGEGLLGGDVLSRFTVTLDYGRGRMYLQPNARFGEPFRRALAGMGIFALPPDFRTFRLTYVDEGGVAAAAGLREGDLIQAVDGRPAGELALHELRDLFKVPGAAYTFTIRRGEETMDVRLVLPTP